MGGLTTDSVAGAHRLFVITADISNYWRTALLFSWLGLRKTQKSLRLTTQGLISFTEGNWSRARRELLSGAKNSQAPWVIICWPLAPVIS